MVQEYWNTDFIFERAVCSQPVLPLSVCCSYCTVTDLEIGRQLGANTLFNLSEYDHEHDHDAKAWTHPA
jgi:hypothetical protein